MPQSVIYIAIFAALDLGRSFLTYRPYIILTGMNIVTHIKGLVKAVIRTALFAAIFDFPIYYPLV